MGLRLLDKTLLALILFEIMQKFYVLLVINKMLRFFMNISDYFTVALIVGGCTTILGWWLKSRLDSSIKHEYDQILESFKSELKRSDVLLTERLNAFKIISQKLLALRRYCRAQSAEMRNESEFEARLESLNENENISLLMHHNSISRELDGIELLISPKSRQSFVELFRQMSMGFNLELWLSSPDISPEVSSNANQLYDLIDQKITDVLEALYSDLGLPDDLSKISKAP